MRMSSRFIATALAAIAIASSPDVANAHGGGLNADGCHTNRKTGEYHCHRSPAPRPQSNFSPSRSNFSGDVPSGSGVSYANCAEVRAAGRAPLRRGQPGYAPHLDRDGDGIACEPYRR